VAGSVASANASDGITTGPSSHILDNHMSENGADGVYCNTACVISGNVATGNGTAGIEVLQDCLVIDNTANFNATGLDLGAPGGTSPSAYSGNVFNENTSAAVANGANGLQTGTNICADNTTCP
jgi:hypothetical protein